MPDIPIPLPVNVSVVAVSSSTTAGWNWRLITRQGQILAESTGTFPSLVDALQDGRRHLEGQSIAC
jgi:hypothetical protein